MRRIIILSAIWSSAIVVFLFLGFERLNEQKKTENLAASLQRESKKPITHEDAIRRANDLLHPPLGEPVPIAYIEVQGYTTITKLVVGLGAIAFYSGPQNLDQAIS